MKDAAILELYWARDEEAIGQTRAAYGTRLFGLADRILRNREDAEESVSDTYLAAWNTIPPQRPNSLFAYLAVICRRFALGRLDWRDARKRQVEIVTLTQEMQQCIPDRRQEDRLEGEELARVLNCFLGELPRESRMIFLRRYWYADSIGEIALRYGISESKVKTRLHRTRRKLRDHLEKEGIRV